MKAALGIAVSAIILALTQLVAIIIASILAKRLPTEGEKEAYLLEEHRKLNKMQRLKGTRL